MNKRLVQAFLLVLMVMISVAACAQASPSSEGAGLADPAEALVSVPPTDAPEAQRTLTLTLSLIRLVDDATNPDPAISSQRTDEDLAAIFDGMNGIWQQAGVQFEPGVVGVLVVPREVLVGINAGDFDPFFAQVGRTFAVPGGATINGFYARGVGGPNGINPFGSRVYFVQDTPSVHDERVSSHEVGHILGLYHVMTDREHLMSPGTNGMLIDGREVLVSRYFAEGIVSGLR